MLSKLMSLFLLGLVRFLTGSQARWYGCPPKAEQRIYFANHQSHADLVMIWAALPQELRSITRPIAAKDYWTKTPFRQWITTAVFNAVYVDRVAGPQGPRPAAEAAGPAAGSPVAPAAPSPVPVPVQEPPLPAPSVAGAPQVPAQSVLEGFHGPGSLPPPAGAAEATPPSPAPAPAPSPEALRAALPEGDPLEPLVRALESGDSIVIFPEGTRGHGDEPQPFKSGLYRLAQMFPQVVLVPAWIQNVQRVMPKGEVVPVPILCSVTFGAPIELAPGEERRAFLDRARRAVIALREV
ncbi:lysophospholipid acyltransferase family protein [Acidovorax sp. NCPPB 4044]|uniref:lysophospholipid acyltransferase family protein n=1 Tax=Acidovorax sp. NCPPB 4044 TaxID=2940490 RepID=UPI0023027168|nr:lysophospholipid acyltransferase family protein [Acidovorax sp. NCPPB 4044]MDA8519307.1 1-acyl-sn-glycerol-3-phosphate acyltransferase [Acidovorax sp. NCPPB 4044]